MMGWRGWLHRWLAQERHQDAEDRLRAVEERETEAMRRVVKAGVRATLKADTSSQAAAAVVKQLEDERNGGDRIIMTAEGVLRLVRGQGR